MKPSQRANRAPEMLELRLVLAAMPATEVSGAESLHYDKVVVAEGPAFLHECSQPQLAADITERLQTTDVNRGADTPASTVNSFPARHHNMIDGPVYEGIHPDAADAAVVAIAGDLNRDGSVDAADYTVWRDSAEATLKSDPKDDLVYLLWAESFGSQAGRFGGDSEQEGPSISQNAQQGLARYAFTLSDGRLGGFTVDPSADPDDLDAFPTGTARRYDGAVSEWTLRNENRDIDIWEVTSAETWNTAGSAYSIFEINLSGPPSEIQPLFTGSAGLTAKYFDRTWPTGALTIATPLDLVGAVFGESLDPDDFQESTVTAFGHDITRISGTTSWDSAAGGVRFSYDNFAPLTEGTTYNVWWASGNTRLGDPLLGDGLAMDRRSGTWSEFLGSLPIPPESADGLLIEIDTGNTTNADFRANNVELLPLDRNLFLASAYDGDPAPDVIGRFFSGVSVANTFTVEVPDALAAFEASVELRIGESVWVQEWNRSSEYRFDGINVGAFAVDSVIEVSAFLDSSSSSREVLGQWHGVLDVELTPVWYALANPVSIGFSAQSGGRYFLYGNLLSLSAANILGVTNSPENPVWFGAGEKFGAVSASVALNIATSLDATSNPAASFDAVIDVATLPGVGDIRLDASPDVNIAIDPRTLNIIDATYRVQQEFTFGEQAFPLFPNQVFKNSAFAVKSEVTISPLLSVEASFNFGQDGIPSDESYVEAVVQGALGGNFAGLSFTPLGLETSLVQGLTRAARVVANPGAFLTSIAERLLVDLGIVPSIDARLKVDGFALFSGRFDVIGGNASQSRVSGELFASASGEVVIAWLGQEELIPTPDSLNDLFSLNVKW